MSRIRTNLITNRMANGAPTVSNGLVISGVCTATSFSGDGANLTSLPAQATIANNADNRVITGGSGVNLNGEANLTFNGSLLNVSARIACDVNSDIDMSSGADGQLIIGGNGYTSAIALNDEGMQIYHNSASRAIIFGTNETERLRITSNGHLLLGTSTDYADVNSDDVQIYSTSDTGISITSGTSHYGSIYFGDGTSGDSRNRGILRYYHGDNSMALWTNASERLRITSAGKLGVGNASPSFLLDVKGATTDTLRISNSNETGHGSHDAKIVAGGSNYHNMRFESSSYKFITFDGSSTYERLRIDSAGNMGLGITPDTQGGNVNSLQIGSATNLYNESSDDYTILGNNVYFDGTNNKYIKTQESSRLMQNAGEFTFQQAASGSADANITYTTPLKISANGYVTKPYQPVFSATTSGTSSAGFIVFNQTSCNVGGHYSTSNGRFTAPVAGTYYFSFYGMAPHNNTSNQRCAIYVNGNYWSAGQYIGGVAYTGYTNNGYTHLTLTTALPLAVNDYVQLSWQYANLHDGHCKFTGFLIG